ncbi:uncharacterized protein [Zea mays]|uniref:uncharacterized protein isoform X2 n=1 Tax=Zea mays TaxID=4577 RepID=UPI0009A9C689|nr:uncharacterized protein LOC109941508 isoform X2 [Zea mays]|eukprot:XP_020398140.1 uncharacterized protein LOC109941508 isoform X2 [Zea mays]
MAAAEQLKELGEKLQAVVPAPADELAKLLEVVLVDLVQDDGGKGGADLRRRAVVEHHGAHARAHLRSVRQGHRGSAADSQRLQSVQFLHVRKLAKLLEKKFTNHLSSLVSIFAVMGSVKINWRHIHC